MVMTMNRIDAEGQQVRDEWTRAASVLAEPMRVVDLYTLRDGKIARLETTLLTPRSGNVHPRSVCKHGKRAE
jgi:hypothetical protein